MKNKKICAVIICAVMSVTLIPMGNSAYAAEYETYEAAEKFSDASESVILSAENAVTEQGTVYNADFNGKPAVVFGDGIGEAVWNFSVPQDGNYNVLFHFLPIESKKLDIEIGMKIDGKYPYKDAEGFNLNRVFKNATDILTDKSGNDYNPQQIEVIDWHKEYFKSNSGNYDTAMSLSLTAGEHTLTIVAKQEPFAISEIILEAPIVIVDYDEYSKLYNDEAVGDYECKYEAEKPSLKSDYSLLASQSRSSIYTTPFSYSLQKLNKIGGQNWNNVGQWLEWEINVPSGGYYYINFRYSQSYNKGLPSNRRLYINGKVPFAQADSLTFSYEPNWDMYGLKLNGEEVKYYLSEGTNTIRLEVTLGEVSKIAAKLENIVYRLNEYYRKIIMITGSEPDTYRDYNLESEIPELTDTFKEIRKELLDTYYQVEEMSNGKGDSGNILKVLAYQLENMIKEPSTIPFRMGSMSSNIGSLSSWSLELKSQALEIDSILITTKRDKPKSGESFFDTVKREVIYFVYSFVVDYNAYDAESNGKSITVWTNTGREQASILRRMIDDMFTPKSGINVSLKLTNANAMQAFLSGNAPDVMLNVDRGLPVNLALRGALYDISKFEDYNDVIKSFSATATDPFKIGNKVYALPVTETFYMFFLRNDVLNEFGIKKPDTWNEFYDALQLLQLNGLEVGVPYTGVDSAAAVDSGMGTKNIFSALLLQSGGSFYNKELTSTDLTSREAIDAFENWTNIYSKYSVALSYNFFNRFRTGEMPMAIALYTEYNQLKTAAPEISGLWSMHPIPGTLKDDGSISRAQGGGGTASVITSVTENPNEAWEFLKWWTGAEAQSRYGSDLEAVLGVAGRHPTANLEAMKNQQWTNAEYNALSAQSKEVVEIPVIAGSYYLTRGIDNAFREVVYDGRNAKEALIVWNREISDEIARKREEIFNE